MPGAFIGNLIDQSTLQRQGRYTLADRVSENAGEKIQTGLFSTAVLYGIGSSLLGGTGGATGGSSGTYLSSSLPDGAAIPAATVIAPNAESTIGRSFESLEEAAAAGGGHQAQVTLTRYGQVVATWWETTQTGQGFSGHTEQRAFSRVIEFIQRTGGSGLELTIVGYYPPCPYGGGCTWLFKNVPSF